MKQVVFQDLIFEINDAKLRIYDKSKNLLQSFDILGMSENTIMAMVKAWLKGHKYQIKDNELKELLYPSKKKISIPPTPTDTIEKVVSKPVKVTPVRRLTEKEETFELPRKKAIEVTDIKVTVVGLDFEGIEAFLRKVAGIRSSAAMSQIMLGVKIYEVPIRMVIKGEVREITVRFWHLSGYDSHASNRQVMYRGSDFVFVVFDFNDKESFSMVSKYVGEAVSFGNCKWIILLGLKERPYPGLKSWTVITTDDVTNLKSNLSKQYRGTVRFDVYTLYKDEADEMRKILRELIGVLIED